METIRTAVLVLSLALVAPVLQAKEVAPDAVLSSVTTEVVATLKQYKELAENPAKVAELIEKKVVPIFDFSRMTQLATARNWRHASAAQQNALTAEFKKLLVRSYSTALAGYCDQVIAYKPLRWEPRDTDATVRSQVRQGAEVLTIDYAMVKTAEGWKVYDVKIDNVSLVTAYREGFAAKVRDAGVDGLIRALAEKNREALSSSRPAMAVAGS